MSRLQEQKPFSVKVLISPVYSHDFIYRAPLLLSDEAAISYLEDLRRNKTTVSHEHDLEEVLKEIDNL